MGHPWGHHPQVPAVLHRPGEEGLGNVQQLAEGLVPPQAVDVKEHGAAAVGVVRGVDRSPGEVPEQPAVYGAAQQLPPLGPPPGPGDVVQQPAVLGAGEVGVGQQPRPGPDGLGVPLLLELGAEGRRPPALPDDGAAHRLAGGLLPQQGGLPLVGQAQGGNVPRGHAAGRHALGRRLELAVQQFQGVVLHPAGLGVVLAEGDLARGHHFPGGGEEDRPGTGGALVQGQEIVLHTVTRFLDEGRWSVVSCPRS